MRGAVNIGWPSGTPSRRGGDYTTLLVEACIETIMSEAYDESGQDRTLATRLAYGAPFHSIEQTNYSYWVVRSHGDVGDGKALLTRSLQQPTSLHYYRIGR